MPRLAPSGRLAALIPGENQKMIACAIAAGVTLLLAIRATRRGPSIPTPASPN